MHKVYVKSLGHNFWLSSHDNPAMITPLQRRMTRIQKSVVSISESISQFQMMLSSMQICYFATSHGEGNTSLEILSQILAKTFPISPAFFQHSVHNCASAYLSILSKSSAPICTMSSGFLSYDLALEFCFKLIRSGSLQETILICADEWLKDTFSSQAEILWMGNENALSRFSRDLKYSDDSNSVGGTFELRCLESENLPHNDNNLDTLFLNFDQVQLETPSAPLFSLSEHYKKPFIRITKSILSGQKMSYWIPR